MDTSVKSDTQPARRRIRTLEEKLRILAEAAQPGASAATVARQHDLNTNVLFAWRRMQHRGLLEGQRHAPPLLPVRITEPTLTPTQRAKPAATTAKSVAATSPATPSFTEILMAHTMRVRLYGESERAVLARLLDALPHR